jgi:hypothetical protein
MNSKKAVLISLLIILFFFLLNIHLVFTVKFEIKNNTLINAFADSKMMISWFHVNIIIDNFKKELKFIIYFSFFSFRLT